MGEDVGISAACSACTDGLQRKYGEHRVLDSPISEGGIVATAIGMAVNGLKPVAEIQFADYIYPAVDQIASELARIRYRSAGDFSARRDPRALRRRHSRRADAFAEPEAIFTHICGIKVVMPSNPYDAKGLLIAAIEDDDPIIFFEPSASTTGPSTATLTNRRAVEHARQGCECPKGTTRCRSASATSCEPASR
jgi:2-oxoisovalerate dehydrogenase E1 component beta subunit